jgi:hypothetical protein
VIRLAIFVEGETEQLFAERLVREMVGRRGLHVHLVQARGGVNTRRRTRIVQAVENVNEPDVQYYVLIVDCSGDGGVLSRLLEEHHHLVNKQYRMLLGLRDAPRDRARIDRVREEFLARVPPGIPVRLAIAIMEIEAWFLAEHTHFTQINEALTPAHIRARLGFDPSADDMRLRDRAASDLNDAYGLVGETYQKGRAAQRTIFLLDLERLIVEMAPNDPDIETFVNAIGDFFQLQD